MASHNIACLVLLFSAPVSGLQVPKPKSPKPKGVSQAATPLWVSSAPADFASGALELWDVLNNPRVAEVLRVAGMGPDETGEKIFESMKGDGYTSLKTVWEAEKEAPKLDALWQLCGICTPKAVHQTLYAFLKATFDPEKTFYIDNDRRTFANEKEFQLELTRLGASGVKRVSGGTLPAEPVEGARLCTNLTVISDGQYYMFWPPLRQSEVLKFKGTLDTHENTLAGFSKRHEEGACTSLETLLTKAYGVVAEINPEKVPYIVDPAETPSIADGIFVVNAGGTEVNSFNMVFVLEAKLSVNVEVLVGKQKGEKRAPPRFVEQLAGYEKAIRKEPSLANYRVVKVLASQTCLPKAMLDEDYMKDIEVMQSKGDIFEFVGKSKASPNYPWYSE